jgi:hypothetical protein
MNLSRERSNQRASHGADADKTRVRILLRNAPVRVALLNLALHLLI